MAPSDPRVSSTPVARGAATPRSLGRVVAAVRLPILALTLTVTWSGIAWGTPTAGPEVEEASPAQKTAASSAFGDGDKAFDVQDYQTALLAFRDSLAQVNSPNSRLMVARCLLELDRLDEAYFEYGQVAQDAADDERYAAAKATALQEQQALRSRLAWVTLKLGDMPPNSVISVDGREVSEDTASTRLPINPGSALIVARAPDGTEGSAEVHLAAGREVIVTLTQNQTQVVGSPTDAAADSANTSKAALSEEPTEQQTAHHPVRPWIYVAGGVAALGAAGVTTFGILAQNRFDNLSEDCVMGQCPPSSQKDIDRGQQYQTLANVSLGVGIAGLTTAAILFFVDRRAGREAPVSVGVGFDTITVSGVF